MPSATVAGETLFVYGSAGADTITITDREMTTAVSELIVEHNGVVENLNGNSVTRFVINTGDGNDVFTCDLVFPMSIDGGGDDDRVSTGPAADTIEAARPSELLQTRHETAFKELGSE